MLSRGNIHPCKNVIIFYQGIEGVEAIVIADETGQKELDLSKV